MSVELVRIEKAVYGGAGLARTSEGKAVFVPFTLPGELVALETAESAGEDVEKNAWPAGLPQVIEPAAARTAPRCPHFGVCGGCHYQHAAYDEQLRLKQEILLETMQRAGVQGLPEIQIHPSDPWEYRNRLRLRAQRVDGELRLGYSVRRTNVFLPIVECPIAAPVLWRAAQALMAAAVRGPEPWLDSLAEVELFCDHSLSRVLMTLYYTSRPLRSSSFETFVDAVRHHCKEIVGVAAVKHNQSTARSAEVFARWGAQGFLYQAGPESYWVSRGAFFQVNRFLVDALVKIVCNGASGSVAWDLFAGVGLFSRVLARSFAHVTAVEANSVAAADLRAALAKVGPHHRAVERTTLDFLRDAVVQRERPEFIVLDPPRAGAGSEACALLARIAAMTLVYVSCDPTTLARDLRQLQAGGYRVSAVHLVDLFPQTFHIETVVVLSRV